MFSCAAASWVAFLCPQDLPFVLIIRGALEKVIAIISVQLEQPNQTLNHLMGNDLDANKTISSLTLFEAAGLASATPLLDQLCQRCQSTIALLNKS